jgi:hypothetical protein
MSYAGTLFLGFVVARNAVPDVRELADDFMAAFEEMKQCMPQAPKVTRATAKRPAATTRRAPASK